MYRLKFALAKAKVLRHLEARVRIGRALPHSKDGLSLLIAQKIHADKEKKVQAARSSVSLHNWPKRGLQQLRQQDKPANRDKNYKLYSKCNNRGL
jgi:hypothetical protein